MGESARTGERGIEREWEKTIKIINMKSDQGVKVAGIFHCLVACHQKAVKAA